MPRDPRAYLWDARHAADSIRVFVEGRSWEDYVTDAMLSSAVERQFEIIGEALNQLSRDDPETAAQIPELARIVAFRNLLIHGYATVDDALVWSLATEKLAELVGVLNELLGER
ncbi:MAG: HepT-like ribonuclease domain-containing protein [Acidimicrobiales bacterium]